MQTLLEALEFLDLKLVDPILQVEQKSFSFDYSQAYFIFLKQEYAELFVDTPTIEEKQPFPRIYYEPLKALWNDLNIQEAKRKGHMFALHDNVNQ